jgi:RNA polymerase sigma-70 factor, ECF subfamily
MGQKEDLLQGLESAIPSLRRYARALSGCGPGASDDLVQTALERAAEKIRSKDLPAGESNPARLCAYRVLTALAREKNGAVAVSKPSTPPPVIVHGLAELPFNEKASLLLVALEGFSYDAAAAVLGVPRAVLLAQLRRARTALSPLDLRSFTTSDRIRRASSYLRLVK